MDCRILAILSFVLYLYTHVCGKEVETTPEAPDIEFDLTSAESDPSLDPGRYLNITPPAPPTEYPPFITGSVKSLHAKLFTGTFNLLLKHGLFSDENEERPGFKTPKELGELIKFELVDEGLDTNQTLDLLTSVVKYSGHPSDSRHLTLDSCGLNPYGFISEVVASTMTNVLLTFYAAPVYTLMEAEMTRKIRELLGYGKAAGDLGAGDGVSVPGGNFANMLALHLAIRREFPETKYHGVQNISRSVAVFLSEEADAGFEAKVAAFEGLPSDAMIKVKVGANGRMDAADLEAQMSKANESGLVPLMVIATLGTPTLGAIDSVSDIVNISEKYGAWLHVDGMRAGPLLVSSSLREHFGFAGIERSDSFAWSGSFLLGLPHTSSFLVTRDAGILENTFSYGAKYVFSTTQLYNHTIDPGDKTVQTARRPDVLKTWFLWKALGQKGIEAHVSHIYKLKDTFKELLTTNWTNVAAGTFKLARPDFDMPLVAFYYVPHGVNENETEKLSATSIELKQHLQNGIMQLSTGYCRETQSTFLVVSLANSVLDTPDLEFIRDTIVYHGQMLKSSTPGAESGSTANAETATDAPTPPKRRLAVPPGVSAPIRDLHASFFQYAFQALLRKGLFFQNKRMEPPRHWRTPEQIAELIDLKLDERSAPATHSDLLTIVDKVITYSAHMSHPFWVYQLFTGLNPYSLVAEYTVAALKPSMVTYEDSPAFTLAEQNVLHKIRQLIGYPNDGEGDGLVNPGGSFSNILAIALARYHKFPATRASGMAADSDLGKRKLVIYVSNGAHYSFQKGSFLLGIGLENCVTVGTDDLGRMSIPLLRAAINKTLEEGGVPLMVAGTAGTTVLGSIDPLEEIAQVCKEYKMWFHVDGVFGGALMVSNKHKKQLKGVESSDSFAVNAHKMYSAAMTISCLVTRHPGIMRAAFGSNVTASTVPGAIAPLYDQAAYDLGDQHMLGHRSSNVFKFWLLWKAQGTSGLGNHIDYVMENSRYAEELLRAQPDVFHLILPEFELTNICFLYIPQGLRGLNKTSEVWKVEMDPVAARLQVILVQNGIMDIVVQTTGSMDTPTFMKLVLMSSVTSRKDIKYLIEQIDFYGQNL